MTSVISVLVSCVPNEDFMVELYYAAWRFDAIVFRENALYPTKPLNWSSRSDIVRGTRKTSRNEQSTPLV